MLNKNVIAILAAFVITIFLLAISYNRVSPTEVGFKINNAGDYRGLDSLPVVTGYNFAFPGLSKIVTLPTTQQHVVWTDDKEEGPEGTTAITVSCMAGAGFRMDVGFNYRIDPYKASHIYLKYRTDDLTTITNSYLRNIVRGAMQDLSGTMTVDSVLNNLPYYEHTVANNLTEKLAKEGFIVDNFNITHQPVPTDSTLAQAISNKITAQQEARTAVVQLQKSVAEANKQIAAARGDSAAAVIRATGDAEAIKVKQSALNQSPQYIELVKAEKWDGKLPMYTGTNGGSLFTIK